MPWLEGVMPHSIRWEVRKRVLPGLAELIMPTQTMHILTIDGVALSKKSCAFEDFLSFTDNKLKGPEFLKASCKVFALEKGQVAYVPTGTVAVPYCSVKHEVKASDLHYIYHIPLVVEKWIESVPAKAMTAICDWIHPWVKKSRGKGKEFMELSDVVTPFIVKHVSEGA